MQRPPVPQPRRALRRAPRAGFTLTELACVMAVLAILIAILMPAMNATRESARQMACLNNVQQISKAILLYTQDYNERFPSGGYPSAIVSGGNVQPRPRGDAHGPNWDPLSGADQTWGWPYQILPYVNPIIDVEDDLVVAASPVEIYVCPTRSGQMIRELVPGWGERVAFDYAGNCGPYLYGSLDPNHPGEVIPEDGPGDSNVPHLGIFGRRPLESRVSLGSLDYSTGTVLIGDKALNNRNGTATDSDTAGWMGGWPVDSVPRGAPNAPPSGPPGRPIPLMTDTIRSGRFPPGPDGPHVFDGFGAPHNGGGNFGFADGHADWISATIDPDAFRKLCSRNKR